METGRADFCADGRRSNELGHLVFHCASAAHRLPPRRQFLPTASSRCGSVSWRPKLVSLGLGSWTACADVIDTFSKAMAYLHGFLRQRNPRWRRRESLRARCTGRRFCLGFPRSTVISTRSPSRQCTLSCPCEFVLSVRSPVQSSRNLTGASQLSLKRPSRNKAPGPLEVPDALGRPAAV